MGEDKAVKRISAFQVGSPRKRGEGLRIGTVRYLPRGIKKKDYAKLDFFDVWLPILAPSKELLGWVKKQGDSPAVRKRFFDRYKKELLKSTDARQVMRTLVELSKRTPLSVGCYCEDESACHRHVLFKLLQLGIK